MVKKNNKLLNRKFYKYLIPGILIALLLRFTSVMDGVIIGNRLGSMCLASTGLSISALYISQLPGYALGVGSAIACSRLIGNRKIDEASKVNSISIITTSILSLLIALLAYPLSEPIAKFIAGGKDEYINYMKIYIFSYWVTSPIIGLLLYYSNIMAVDNHPILSTAMVLVSSALKLLFMLITLYSFNINDLNLGMYLASFSTAFGALISLVVVIFYLKSKKRLLKFSFKIDKPLLHLKEAIVSGMAAILTYLLTSIQLLVIDVNLSRALNDEEMLIYGVITNMVFVVELFTAGVIQLIPSLVGVLYGEEDYRGVYNLSKKMFLICEMISLIIMSIFLIYPKLLLDMFGYQPIVSNDYIYNFSYKAIRIYSLIYIFNQANMFGITYYPSTNKPFIANISVILRTILLSLLFVIPLSYNNGLIGYSIANVLNESLTFIIILIIIYVYKLKKKDLKTVFLIPDISKICDLDFTISTDKERIEGKEKIYEYLYKKIDSTVLLDVTNMFDNITKRIQDSGYLNKNNYIDINLKETSDYFILCIRDDGKILDDVNKEDNKIAVSYIRCINLNNTIIKIKKEEIKNGN